MAILFNADEILQMAEQIERNGMRFYSLAAEKLKQHKDIFLQLARQEEEHLAVFSEMRRKLGADEQGASSYDPNDENDLYLQAMADREVFGIDQDPRQLFPSAVSLSGVIDMAIGKEKDSIVFYAGIREFVPVKFGFDKIEAIIKEEFRHILVLRAIVMNR